MNSYSIQLDLPESFAENLQMKDCEVYVMGENGQLLRVKGLLPSSSHPVEDMAHIKVKWLTRTLIKCKAVINRLKSMS